MTLMKTRFVLRSVMGSGGELVTRKEAAVVVIGGSFGAGDEMSISDN